MKELATIGELAKWAKVGPETIRYYEKRGLVVPHKRTAAGYRLYDETAFKRLRFIRRGQLLGFTLNEIHELLSISNEQQGNVAEVKRLAENKITDIRRRIAALNRVLGALVDLSIRCPGTGPLTECPMLIALEADEAEEIEAEEFMKESA